MEASPSLGAEGLLLEASVSVGGREEQPYVHRLYDADERSFEERLSTTARRRVRVELELKGSYLTPAGPLLSAAAGRGEAEFAYTASATGEKDETMEGGTW